MKKHEQIYHSEVINLKKNSLYDNQFFFFITYVIVTDMEGNIRIYRLPKGRGTDQWK